MRLRLPSLVMLNLDWTCVTELSSLHYLRENGEALECVALFSFPPWSLSSLLPPSLTYFFPLPNSCCLHACMYLKT